MLGEMFLMVGTIHAVVKAMLEIAVEMHFPDGARGKSQLLQMFGNRDLIFGKGWLQQGDPRGVRQFPGNQRLA